MCRFDSCDHCLMFYFYCLSVIVFSGFMARKFHWLSLSLRCLCRNCPMIIKKETFQYGICLALQAASQNQGSWCSCWRMFWLIALTYGSLSFVWLLFSVEAVDVQLVDGSVCTYPVRVLKTNSASLEVERLVLFFVAGHWHVCAFYVSCCAVMCGPDWQGISVCDGYAMFSNLAASFPSPFFLSSAGPEVPHWDCTRGGYQRQGWHQVSAGEMIKGS